MADLITNISIYRWHDRIRFYIHHVNYMSFDTWQYSINGGSWVGGRSSVTNSKLIDLQNLSPDTAYNVTVRAWSSSNSGAIYQSDVLAFRTLGCATIKSATISSIDLDTVNISINYVSYSTAYIYRLRGVGLSGELFSISNIPLAPGTGDYTAALTSAQRADILKSMPDKKTIPFTLYLDTLKNGVVIDNGDCDYASRDIGGNFNTSAARSSPQFTSFSYADINTLSVALTKNNKTLIKNASDLMVTATAATARNYATISSYQVAAGGVFASSVTTSILLGKIPEAGNIPIIVTAIDSRGYTTTVTINVQVLDYEPIAITDYSLRRKNEVESMTQINVIGVTSAVMISGANKNRFQTLRYRYKHTSDEIYSSWVSLTPVVNDTSFEYANPEFIILNEDYSFHIEIEVSDLLSVASAVFTLPQGIPLLSFRKKRIGINVKEPSAALDVKGGAIIDGQDILQKLIDLEERIRRLGG